MLGGPRGGQVQIGRVGDDYRGLAISQYGADRLLRLALQERHLDGVIEREPRPTASPVHAQDLDVPSLRQVVGQTQGRYVGFRRAHSRSATPSGCESGRPRHDASRARRVASHRACSAPPSPWLARRTTSDRLGCAHELRAVRGPRAVPSHGARLRGEGDRPARRPVGPRPPLPGRRRAEDGSAGPVRAERARGVRRRRRRLHQPVRGHRGDRPRRPVDGHHARGGRRTRASTRS